MHALERIGGLRFEKESESLIWIPAKMVYVHFALMLLEKRRISLSLWIKNHEEGNTKLFHSYRY